MMSVVLSEAVFVSSPRYSQNKIEFIVIVSRKASLPI